MNTPTLITDRLILRRFSENDIDAIYSIFSDAEVNTFLPWFPLKSLDEARCFFKEKYDRQYKQAIAYNYAVYLKSDNSPIGYINVSTDDSRDFGYGLLKRFWHKGIAAEAGKAVTEQLKKDGIPYITATHDIKNPRSGGVMKKLGMKYCYSYKEQWMPKNISDTFRMYQLNLDGNENRIYKKYWENSTVHFIEKDL